MSSKNQTPLTWPEIRKASQAAGFYHGYMAAEENAGETIYVEKAAPEEDYDRIALGSLEQALAYSQLDKANPFPQSPARKLSGEITRR
ncbi:hypothetical protein AB4037_23230 [Labrys sp. KB_33_2]|uniref:hypothetical protein n=1 Tax=Labrys sp. KB_33_2 TaxID=3237479 RepID=UPI003F92A1F7